MRLTKDYVVGFLESEGSFGAFQCRCNGRTYIYPQITVGQNELNIIQEVRKFVGRGTITKFKNFYNLNWQGKKAVAHLIKFLNLPNTLRMNKTKLRFDLMMRWMK